MGSQEPWAWNANAGAGSQEPVAGEQRPGRGDAAELTNGGRVAAVLLALLGFVPTAGLVIVTYWLAVYDRWYVGPSGLVALLLVLLGAGGAHFLAAAGVWRGRRWGRLLGMGVAAFGVLTFGSLAFIWGPLGNDLVNSVGFSLLFLYACVFIALAIPRSRPSSSQASADEAHHGGESYGPQPPGQGP